MIAWLLLLAAAPGAESATKATETLAASCLDHKFETTSARPDPTASREDPRSRSAASPDKATPTGSER